MADESLTTPRAFSRRFLLSAAAAMPIGAIPAGAIPAGATATTLSPVPGTIMTLMPAGLPTLLACYREIGIRLREVEAAHARTIQIIPETDRPGASGKGKRRNTVSRWPEWTRKELKALGLPSSTPLRPSLADFDLQYRRSLSKAPENWEELERRHKVRLDAWHARRKQQREFQQQAGLDDINRRRRTLLADKHGIERTLLALMTSPAGAFIDA